MNTLKNSVLGKLAIVILMAGIALPGCKKKSDDEPEAPKTVYNLKAKNFISVSGTATFTKTSSTSTQIDIVITHSPAGTHPAQINNKTAIETGTKAISLNPVDATGKSSTVVVSTVSGALITYEQLIAFDGYLDVYESSTNLTSIVAEGDIGGNFITSTNKSYPLNPKNSSGISGTVLLEKRKNGNALWTVSCSGLLSGNYYPARMLLGSVATVGGGTPKLTLGLVNGNNGKSYTSVRKLDDGTAINYDQALLYDGYVDVYADSTFATILCNGDIGTH